MDRLEAVNNMFKDLKGNKGISAFVQFTSSVKSASTLEPRVKDLILIALAVYSQCEPCIVVHISSAVENGASKEEILDAAMMAVVMGGGPKLMYLSVVNEELNNIF